MACIMLASVLMGCIEGQDDVGHSDAIEPTIVEYNMVVTSRRVNESYRWDVKLTFYVSGEDRSISWRGLRVSLRTIQGIEEVLEVVSRPSNLPEDRMAYYVDLFGIDGRIDEGDYVILVGLTREHQGATVDLNYVPRNETLPGRWNETLTLALSQPRFESRDDTQDVWNARMTVEAVEPDWERIPWSWLSVWHGRSQPAGRWSSLDPLPAGGLALHEQGRLFYIDAEPSDGLAGPGDELLLSTFDTTWSRASISLRTGSMYICEMIQLPKYFPCLSGTATVSEPSVTTRVDGALTYTDLEYRVTDISTDQPTVAWEDCLLVLENYSWSKTLEFPPSGEELYGTREHAWTVDDGDGMVSPGDVLRTTGHTQSFVAGTLNVLTSGQLVCSGDIPQIFQGMFNTIHLSWPEMTSRQTGSGIRWDAVYEVRYLYPYFIEIPWSNVSGYLTDILSTKVVHPPTPLTRSMSATGEEVEILYRETGEDDGIISEGDQIVLRGMDHRHQGCSLVVSLDGLDFGRRGLPVAFEPLQVSKPLFNVSFEMIWHVPVNGTPYWKVLLRVMNTSLASSKVPWSNITLMVTAYYSEVLAQDLELDPLTALEKEGWDGWNTKGLRAYRFDYSPDDEWLDDEDKIALSGLTDNFVSAGILVYVDDIIAAAASLPGTFPDG